jgi:tRNA(Arg) A34 adenosine deaminase TadA
MAITIRGGRAVAVCALALLAIPGCGKATATSGSGAGMGHEGADAGRAVRAAARSGARCRSTGWRAYAPSPAERERDEIFSLLAYAVAFDDWQVDEQYGRGRNIAAVIVDAAERPVCWGRNQIAADDDATQHAELRAITSYLKSAPGTHAKGVRLYTTLEPCAMCAGATIMTGVGTVLYGRHAGSSGRVFERLAFDGHDRGGYCPYRHGVMAHEAPTPFVARLDALKIRNQGADRADANEAARLVHADAAHALDTYETRNPGNAAVLAAARAYRLGIPRGPVAVPYRIGCPSFDAPGAGSRP